MHYREYLRFTEIGALFSFVVFLINPILSPYIKGMGLDDFQVGLIFSLYPLSVIVFSPMMGSISDAVGRRIMIVFGIAMEMLAMILYVIDGSWLVIAVARIFNAIGYITVSLIILAKIEDSIDGESRGKYGGITLSAEYASKMIAPAVGGLVADMFFVRAPFYMAFFCLIVFLVYFMRTKPKRHGKIKKQSFNIFQQLRSFLSVRKLRGMGILGFAFHSSMPAINVFLPILIVEKFGLSYSYIGIAYVALGLFNMFQFYFGKLSDRSGRTRFIVSGTVIYALGLVLLSMSPSYIILLTVMTMMGIGGSMWNVSAWSFLSDIGESSGREASTLTSYQSLAKIGSFLSYIWGGLIAQLYGIEALMFASGIVLLGGIILSATMLKGK